MAAHLSRLGVLQAYTRMETEKEHEKVESLNGLVREFSDFIDQFVDRMKRMLYRGAKAMLSVITQRMLGNYFKQHMRLHSGQHQRAERGSLVDCPAGDVRPSAKHLWRFPEPIPDAGIPELLGYFSFPPTMSDSLVFWP